MGTQKADANEVLGEVLLFAAASTSDAVDAIVKQFQRDHQGVKVRVSYAATSTLAQQIAAGAKADLLIAASDDWAAFLAKKNLVARQQELLGNELVIVVPADSKLKISEPKHLLDDTVRRLALADPESVPAGIYAKQALTKLQFWKQIEPKVVGAADVRQALKFVESGAAQAGIVYATDAAGGTAVRVAAKIDSRLSDPIRYPLVLLNRGAKNEAALELYKALSSQSAADTFRQHGFVIPKSAEKK